MGRYVTDEGRWVENARSLALRGTLFEQSWNIRFLMAPLFQIGTFVAFAVGGVSLLTSRLLTALSGSAMLVLFWVLLRHTVKREALVLGMTLLAVQADLVMLSRVAVPEMTSMLAQLASYARVVGGRVSPGRMVLAGVALAAAVGFKATAVLVLPIFAIIVVAAARQRAAVERSRGWRGRGGATEFLLVFPVVASAGWLALDAAGMPGFSFWARGAAATHIAVWSALLTGMGVVAAVLAGHAAWDAAKGRARVVTALAMGYLMVSLAGIAPGYLDPYYSIRDASRDLGIRLRDSGLIIAVSPKACSRRTRSDTSTWASRVCTRTRRRRWSLRSRSRAPS